MKKEKTGTSMIVMGLITESKEAPRREAQERAWKKQEEREKAK